MRRGPPSARPLLRFPQAWALLLPLLLLLLPAQAGGDGREEAELHSKEEEGHGASSESHAVEDERKASSKESLEFGELVPAKEGEEEGEEEGKDGAERSGEEAESPEEAKEAEEMVHIDIAIGCMLLGSIALQMGLLYLMNYPDDDIMKSSWEVISSTLSIFVAVLDFHAFHEISVALEVNAGKAEVLPGGEVIHLGSLVFCFLLIFTLMHLVIAQQIFSDRSSPDVDENCSHMDHMEDQARLGIFNTVETAKGKRKRITKSWAILLAHIASFSGIHAGTHIMKLEAFEAWPASTLAVPICFLVLLFGLFRLSDWARSSCMKNLSHEAHEEWDEEAEEAEKDIATIALSFLMIQTVRYCISGVLPNSGGLEVPQKVHPVACIWILMSVGLVFYILTSIMVAFIAYETAEKIRGSQTTEDHKQLRMTLTLVDLDHAAHAGLDPIGLYFTRWYKICPKVLASCGSWCLLWACKWAQTLVPQFQVHFSQNSTAMFVALALFVSLAMFILILGLDYVADLQFTGPICDVTIRAVIDSLGILVGFTWELSFSSGLEGIAELARGHGHHAPLICKLVLAVIISIIVIPAWRSNILKKVLELRYLEAQKIIRDFEEDGMVDQSQALQYELEHEHLPMPSEHNDLYRSYTSEGGKRTMEDVRSVQCEAGQ